MEGPATVNDQQSKTRRVPGTTYFSSDVERRGMAFNRAARSDHRK